MKAWQKRITSRSLFPLGIEVGATLAAAHGETGEAVLEDLLEAKKFEHALGDGGMKAQSAFVGSNGVVKLDAPAAIDAHAAVVGFPSDAKGDDAIGFGEALEDAGLAVFGVLFNVGKEVGHDLFDGLVKFQFAGIAFFQSGHELVEALFRRKGVVGAKFVFHDAVCVLSLGKKKGENELPPFS